MFPLSAKSVMEASSISATSPSLTVEPPLLSVFSEPCASGLHEMASSPPSAGGLAVVSKPACISSALDSSGCPSSLSFGSTTCPLKS
ncbi:hypothetical protein BDZ89DRAFT_415656 [Hymenopellis radicata]|nr:hypothetical protein BDZ89DRAFT_415656 [Hymenopellis radicata]